MTDARAEGAGSFRVQIGPTVMDAAAHDEIAKELKAENDFYRVAGLSDDLNPGLLDPAKVDAFLKGIVAPGTHTATLLNGRVLNLKYDLGLGYAFPTTVASFQPPIHLQVAHDSSGPVARADFSIDCAAASATAAAARRRFEQAESDIAALGDPPDADTGQSNTIGAAKRLRFIVSGAWAINAKARVGCVPGDTAAQADLAAAEKAQGNSYVSLGMGRMPQ